MTAEFEVNGGQTTIRFEYTADTDKVQAVAESASHHLFNQQIDDNPGIKFDTLTNQQKLNILDKGIKHWILDQARRYHFIVADAAARAQMIQDADNNYNLGV